MIEDYNPKITWKLYDENNVIDYEHFGIPFILMEDKGLGNNFYKNYFVDYLNKFKQASRKEINQLIYPRLPLNYSDEDKKKKVQYLLTSLRQKDVIVNIGSDTKPIWKLK